MNGIMLHVIRTLLVKTGLPTNLWGEAFKFVIVAHNFSPSKAIQGRTPYELFEGRKPNVSGLRVWGCAVIYFVPKVKRIGKHDPTAREALFLGYPESSIGYRVLDLVFGRIVESRDVTFREQWTTM
ncbi:Integrase, catalytic core protein [Phytophthora megakarya]|uniref:Integrase, catalytic core protein n=1 Tax=Phytophthora megakarya TaxID=4795 RepID=A0A225UKM9_9STRA|nr:Integrase, catalytic core protein [Phytophthora megakarya]